MIRMKMATVGPDGFFVDAQEPVPPAWITQYSSWTRDQLAVDSAYDDGTPNQAEFPPEASPVTPPLMPVVPANSLAPPGVVRPVAVATGNVLDASATLQSRRSVEG